MDGLGKNNSVDIIKEEPKDGNIFAKEANRKGEEDNNVITFLKSEDMKNEDKELRETGNTFEMLGHQQAVEETMIEKGITKTEDPSMMDYEEGINCFVVTAAAEFHVVPFRQNKKNYPCTETVVEEINEDVLQENNSAACEDIIEMKNDDTNKEEEMKTVIMISDDEDEENTLLSTLNSSTEILENKEIKKESISNYDYCNVAVEEIKEYFECEANEDVLQENKSAVCEDIIEMKNDDTDNEEEMKTVIMIVDDEDEENTPLSTLNSSTEILENKEIKRESISNYDYCNVAVEEIKEYFECEANEDVLQENKSAACEDIIEMKNDDTDNEEEMKAVIMISDDEDEENTPLSTLNSSTEILENKEIKRESISNYDYCNVAVEEIKEYFECEANEDVLQENKSAVCEDIIEMKNDDTDNEEEMKTVIMIVDDEDEENTPLSTLNSSTEILENKEIKRESISNYDYCNVAVEEIKEYFECEANEDVLQENKSAVCEDIIEMKNDDTDNEEEMKTVIMIVDDEDEENTPLSAVNSSTEILENKEIKRKSISNYDYCNVAVEEIKEYFECEANEDVLQENKSAVCEDIIEMKNDDTDNEEEMKAVIMIVDDGDEENTPLSTLNSSTEKFEIKEIKKESISNYDSCNAANTDTSLFEGVRYEPGNSRKIDFRRTNFLKTLQEYHNLQKPKPNNTNTKTKVWSDLCCPLSKQSYKHLKSLETHMKDHGKWNLQEEKVDEEKNPLSTPKFISTERLQKHETKKDKDNEGKIPLSTPKPFSTERLQKNEKKKDKEAEETIPLSTPKSFSTERLQKHETKKDKEDEEKIALSTPRPFSTERLQNKDNISDNDFCNAADIDRIRGALMCPLCQQFYKHQKSLENHMKKMHDKWDCQMEKDKEKIPLSTPKPISTERIENNDIKEDKMSIDISTLFERVHNESDRCPEIDRRIDFLKSLKNYHNSNKPKTNNTNRRIKICKGFSCVICKRSYKHRESLLIHNKSHDNLAIFKIEPDGDLIRIRHKSACFKDKEKADNHYNRSLDSKIYKCLTCYKSYTDAFKLEAHKRYAHKHEKLFFSVCKKCGKTFPNETTLSDHEKSGCATSPIFKCDDCGKILRHVSSFKHHRTLHTGELRHFCYFCGKAFRSHKMARKHEREHCKEELFKCSICSFVFADKKSLTTHFALHSA